MQTVNSSEFLSFGESNGLIELSMEVYTVFIRGYRMLKSYVHCALVMLNIIFHFIPFKPQSRFQSAEDDMFCDIFLPADK